MEHIYMRKVKPVVLMKFERSLSLPPGAQSNLVSPWRPHKNVKNLVSRTEIGCLNLNQKSKFKQKIILDQKLQTQINFRVNQNKIFCQL
jgi:hypothetical protein